MDKARRQNRELAALLAVGVFGLAVELIGATRGAHGPLVGGFGMLITWGGAFAFFGYRRQETQGEGR